MWWRAWWVWLREMVATPWRFIIAWSIIPSLDTCERFAFAPLLGFGNIWAIILKVALLPHVKHHIFLCFFPININEKILNLQGHTSKEPQVKCACPREILDGWPIGKFSRVRMSEDKVRAKDSCWSVEMVYCPKELPGVSLV
jgi:hypothetical protein